MEEFALIRYGSEYILLVNPRDTAAVHSLATIRSVRSSNRWIVQQPVGRAKRLVYAVSTPLNAAQLFLESLGRRGPIQVVT